MFSIKGATIKQTEHSNFVIARIMDGGSIGQTNLLEPGDCILEINNVSLKNSKPEEILNLLVSRLVLSITL
jgi:C-terminal processing protease CtpA/Prc